RAIGGVYPSGSTFKPVTALAGLATHVIDASTIVDDPGCIQLGLGKANQRCNAGHKPHGPVNVSTALQVSSNVFFFGLALKLNPLAKQPLQKWARDLGYGKRTGVDLPAESEGIVPDAAWRDRINAKELACRREEHRKSCGYGDGESRPWSPGDEAALATGQGDLNASPIQVAVSYAALANGGTVVRPHLGLDVLNEQGELEQRITSGGGRHVAIDPDDLRAVMGGLLASTSEVNGTTVDVFSDWPHDQIPIYGKTGTAVRPLRPDDQSWFACYAYFGAKKEKPIVIVTTIEDAGLGAAAAAPATKLMLAEWFGVENVEATIGTSNDR
ncbi:MAG TPA: penicillin-binding transpeptidase domain-containing protein, partial [Baekduia sp.]|nr:penicillin-binding transpeptidase domain-containing protein [Baekduia sp.]